MTTQSGSWKGIMRRAGASTIEHLEQIAAMDEPASVTPILTTQQIENRLRELNNRLVGLEAEYDKTRQEVLRLQGQYIKRVREYMIGWTISIEPPADAVKGADGEPIT